MCGRFVSSSTPEKIAEYFGAAFEGETLGENYNVAPTNDIYGVVVGPDGEARLEVFHWGLIPVWAKERKIGQRMINARSETMASKPAYKGVFKKNRCLIPMDGFYEWQAGQPGGPVTKAGKPAKQPMFISRLDGEPLAVAGLWSAWRDPESSDPDWLHSATVITTSANGTMSPIHDRMPVILPQSAWEAWLDPNNNDIESLSKLLIPAPDTLLQVRAVSTDVNNVRNKGPHLIDPAWPVQLRRSTTSARPIAVSSARIAAAAASSSSRSTCSAALANATLGHRVRRDHVDVGVRHLVAGDDHPDPLAPERSLLRQTDHPRHLEEVGDEVGRGIDPVVDLLDRHHQHVPMSQRVDGEEGDAAVVAPHERPGDLAGDDPAEDCRHVREGRFPAA